MNNLNTKLTVLCTDVVNKITNITEQSCARMEELRAELAATKEKLKCEKSFRNSSKFQNFNESKSKLKESSVANPTIENTLETKESQNFEKNKCDEKDSENQIIYKMRYKQFQELKKIEKILCYELGISPKYEKYEILSPEKMEQYKKDLQKLYVVKKKRQQHYSEMMVEIKALLSELEIFTWSEFEKSALNEHEFIVTAENLNALHEWKIRLIAQYEHERQLIEDLKQKICKQWDKLEISNTYRQEFQDKVFTIQNRKLIINEMQIELHRCEKLWRQKIRQTVGDMRKEIIDFWVKCNVGQKQRDRFIAFNSEVYDEELMNVHKQEIEQLKKLHQETTELNELAIKWSELREKVALLETNTNRFNNRGGNLLKEEKERKKYHKSISALESKIMHAAAKYKSQQDSHFFFNGRPLIQIIEESRICTRKGKENQSKRDKMLSRKGNQELSKLRENISCKSNRAKSLFKPRISSHGTLGSFTTCALRM